MPRTGTSTRTSASDAASRAHDRVARPARSASITWETSRPGTTRPAGARDDVRQALAHSAPRPAHPASRGCRLAPLRRRRLRAVTTQVEALTSGRARASNAPAAPVGHIRMGSGAPLPHCEFGRSHPVGHCPHAAGADVDRNVLARPHPSWFNRDANLRTGLLGEPRDGRTPESVERRRRRRAAARRPSRPPPSPGQPPRA